MIVVAAGGVVVAGGATIVLHHLRVGRPSLRLRGLKARLVKADPAPAVVSRREIRSVARAGSTAKVPEAVRVDKGAKTTVVAGPRPFAPSPSRCRAR